MDPFSVAGACIALVGTITKTSAQVTTFVRDFRAARGELDAVARELSSLKTVLELLGDDFKDPISKPCPAVLDKQIEGIIRNCLTVLTDIEETLDNHGGSGIQRAAWWATVGRDSIVRLRTNLEAHKSALEIALDFVAITMIRDIKADTQDIHYHTSVIPSIKEDTTHILTEISRLQKQLPQDTKPQRESWSMLNEYLDNLTNYAESVCGTVSEKYEDEIFSATESRGDNCEKFPLDSPQDRNSITTKQDPWDRPTVKPEEVEHLLKCCTVEFKSRALDTPLFLLPFRSVSSEGAVARRFIRQFFSSYDEQRNSTLELELRLLGIAVLSSLVKWCWCRLSGGVVTWDVYEHFSKGERDSGTAEYPFKASISLAINDSTRENIVIDFFDLISTIAARSQEIFTIFTAHKLFRLAGWWAFENKNLDDGFDGGYKRWMRSADATSHLFFAYLRSLKGPDPMFMEKFPPMDLNKALRETEYPPRMPLLLKSPATKCTTLVSSYSPTPIALLQRTNHLPYGNRDQSIKESYRLDDSARWPWTTLECHRILELISSENTMSNQENRSWDDFVSQQHRLSEDLEPAKMANVMSFEMTIPFGGYG